MEFIGDLQREVNELKVQKINSKREAWAIDKKVQEQAEAPRALQAVDRTVL